MHRIITTSWDDGHPMDFKLAEMLKKYSLAATFYIPRRNAEREVITVNQIKNLACDFEIGAHTLNHVRINTSDKHMINNEVKGSYLWLEDVLGIQPVSFCFPGGKFSTYAIGSVINAGFKIARTTELFSLKTTGSYKQMPTTLQVYQHSGITYVKHLLKRKKFTSVVNWIKKGAQIDVVQLTENFIKTADEHGGCFHLWGHSWEIEEFKLWDKLEEIFKVISYKKNFSYLTNAQAAAI